MAMDDPTLNRAGDWIASGGGPLLVLPEAGLSYWNGADESASGVVPVPANSPTDYERACSVRDRVGVITVGPGEGIVLADEPLDTRWWRAHEMGPLHLVRWVYGDSDAAVLRVLPGIDRLRLKPAEVLFTNNSKRVVLFDAAMSGTDILTPYSSVALAPGVYAVEAGEFNPDPSTRLQVVRLVPQSTLM